MKRIFSAIIFSLFLATSAHAEKVSRHFDQIVQDEGYRMPLCGTGNKLIWLQKALEAGFYLNEGVEAKDALKDVPKRIEVEYFRRIPGSALTSFTISRMRMNSSQKISLAFPMK